MPKQYVPIAGVCAFRRSVTRFLAQRDIARVQPVIHADDSAMFQDAMNGLDDARLAAPVTGGATRALSVLEGLHALAGDPPDVVLIHDAARPFVGDDVIQGVLAALETSPGAFAALRVVDALWRVDGAQAMEPEDRTGLWRAQTPQGFHFAPLLEAHMTAAADAADDVQIARAAGMAVIVVPGATDNFKITTPEDLARAERIAAQAGVA